MTNTTTNLADLDWVKLNSDMDVVAVRPETFSEKFSRKFSENPLIPVGALMTCGALAYGLWSFNRGDRKTSQLMMRSRIVAQGFTIVAFVGGIALAAKRSK